MADFSLLFQLVILYGRENRDSAYPRRRIALTAGKGGYRPPSPAHDSSDLCGDFKVRSLDKRIAKARVFKLKDKETWLYEKKQVLLKYLFMED